MTTITLATSSYLGYLGLGSMGLGLGNEQLGEIYLASTFVPRNFTVRRGLEGPQLVVSWDAPSGLADTGLFPAGTYTVRLERRTLDFSYRLGEGEVLYTGTLDDSHVVADLVPDAAVDRLDGVVGLTAYYYTLFILEASSGLYVMDPRLQRNEFTVPTGYFNQKMYDLLPPVYRNLDSVDVAQGGTVQAILVDRVGTGEVEGERFNFQEDQKVKRGQLFRFLKLKSLEFDLIRGLCEYAMVSKDLDVCDRRYLGRLAGNVGLALIEGLRVERQRADLRQIVHFFKYKGTAEAAVSRGTAVSGSRDVTFKEYQGNTLLASAPTRTTENVSIPDNRNDLTGVKFDDGSTDATGKILSFMKQLGHYSFVPGDVLTVTAGASGVVLGSVKIVSYSHYVPTMVLPTSVGANLAQVSGFLSRTLDPSQTHPGFGGALYLFSGDTNEGQAVTSIDPDISPPQSVAAYHPWQEMENTGEFTAEFWVKVSEWPNDPAAVSTITSAILLERFYEDGGNFATFKIKLNSARLAGSGLVAHRIAAYYNAAGTDVFVGQVKEEAGVLALGRAFHCAVVREAADVAAPLGTVWKIYVDGALVFTSGTIAYTAPTLPLGFAFPPKLIVGNATTMNGAAVTLDEVRVWSVARTQAEIQGLMNRPINGAQQGLVLYYPADASIQSTLFDSSSFLNHGTMATTAGHLPQVVAGLVPDPAATLGWNQRIHQKGLLGDNGFYTPGKIYGTKAAALLVGQMSPDNHFEVATA